MTNPFDRMAGAIADAVGAAFNPNPTAVAAYERDGHLYLKVIYGNTSGGEMNIRLPAKDLKSLQQAILDHLLRG